MMSRMCPECGHSIVYEHISFVTYFSFTWGSIPRYGKNSYAKKCAACTNRTWFTCNYILEYTRGDLQ